MGYGQFSQPANGPPDAEDNDRAHGGRGRVLHLDLPQRGGTEQWEQPIVRLDVQLPPRLPSPTRVKQQIAAANKIKSLAEGFQGRRTIPTAGISDKPHQEPLRAQAFRIDLALHGARRNDHLTISSVRGRPLKHRDTEGMTGMQVGDAACDRERTP